MQLAHCLLLLGGDAGQTVQKYNVTPSEVAVLRLIHGNDSVIDLQVFGSVDRPHMRERARLVEAYGRGMDGVIRCPAVDQLFPGAAARLFETFAEIEQFDEDGEGDLTGEVITPIAEPEIIEPLKPTKKPRKAKAEEPPPEVDETPETAFA